MILPENDYQLLKLTKDFYETYPPSSYREILKKENRAYNCLLFQTHYDYFICIPYRTEISHRYAYHFKKSARSRKHKSGLDYTKIVILSKTAYLDRKNAVIDRDEFLETLENLDQIKREALEFVQDYIDQLSGNQKLDQEEFKRRYQYSPLKYFHKELGL